MTDAKVNHAFVSQIEDDSNDKLVRPSNWNDDLLLTGGDTNQAMVRNDASASGAGWQDKGVSYLTDELGNALTDELGNALEGVDTVDARLLVNSDPVFFEISDADSPFTLVRPSSGKSIIVVDDSEANVVINLYVRIKGDVITIKKKGSVTFKTTYNADGSDTIDGAASREILTQYTADILVGEAEEWGRH